MATALDVVGDRWALLVVRELLLGSRRFGELANGLPGVGTDILTARLRQLEGAGVVARIGAGRQQRYELTDCGQALRPVLVELARWGSHRLGLPANPQDVSPRVALTSILIDPPAPPTGLRGHFRLTVEEETAGVRVDDGRIVIDPSPGGDEPSTVISLTREGMLGLLVGARARALARSGDLTVAGRRNDGLRLVDTVRAPKVLAGLDLASRAHS
ncbi:MAG TPA: helix-turn-helix domain-containing protein [Acidimicrobiales bacterium]|nr:helix-turn-helix domain-containing protein [Acidimicrobiales bacterium]